VPAFCRAVSQAYPTKRALAEAFRGRLAGAAGDKRKLTKLKRVILRERAAKAAADAAAAHENALAAAAAAAAFREGVTAQLQARAGMTVACEQWVAHVSCGVRHASKGSIDVLVLRWWRLRSPPNVAEQEPTWVRARRPRRVQRSPW
jgi:hypothetical protein